MKFDKKIPAFTLMEVTIAMLVAAIAIAITYTAFRIIGGSYNGYTRKQEMVAEVLQIDKLLKQDFLQADRIVRAGEGLILETEEGVISYAFGDSTVLRDQFSLRTDTFRVSTDPVSISFENELVEDGLLADQLTLQVRAEGQQMPLHYLKIYSAQDLFE